LNLSTGVAIVISSLKRLEMTTAGRHQINNRKLLRSFKL